MPISFKRFFNQYDPVVIVDDDRDDTFLLRRLLQHANIPNPAFTFDNVRSAIDYLGYLTRESVPLAPRLIFTDLRMSPVDGFAFIVWLRTQHQFQKVQIAAMSGAESPGDMQKAFDAGANLFFVKFPSPRRLLDSLEKSIETGAPQIIVSAGA